MSRPLPEAAIQDLWAARRRVLERRIRLIVAATIGYNVIEAVIALAAGRAATSSALIGFGLDSGVEVLSAAAVAWQFSGRDPERRERAALRLIAVSFFGLAAVVGVGSVRALLGLAEPSHSTVGIALAAVSLAIMPFLSWIERRTARELGSASALADSKQTLICTYLSAVLLLGLLLNSLLGWQWADPAAALVIAAVAVREGLQAWRGDACCAPTPARDAQPGGAMDAGPGAVRAGEAMTAPATPDRSAELGCCKEPGCCTKPGRRAEPGRRDAAETADARKSPGPSPE